MSKNKCFALICFLFITQILYGAKPLGERFNLISNNEVGVIDNRNSGYFDIYEPESNSYEQSFALPGVAKDIASGDLNNSGYDEIIGVYSNSIYIRWYDGSSWQGQSYDLGKNEMQYVACGDYFEDSLNAGCEIITASQDTIFWWKWTQNAMELLKSSGHSGGVYDICSGDIDGDRYDEVVYLTSAKDGLNLEYINEDGSIHTFPTSIIPNRGSFTTLSAGNLREDIKEEIVILENNSWPWNDVLHFYEYDQMDSTFVEIKTMDVGHGGDRDLACGNADVDKYEEVFLLRDDKKVDVYNYDEKEGTFSLMGSSDPIRITAPNWDGDNAQVVFIGGPYLCSSELWPSLVISLPPYHNGIIEGECTIKYGEDYQQNHNLNATFAITAQTTMGYGYKFPGGLFEASVNASIEAGVKKNLKESQTFSWGSWYIISSSYPHNIVMATRTYYNGFFYKILDPRNLLGDTLDQDTINMAVPMASGNNPITLENYLAYADTIDYLPKGLLLPIQQPGDVTTYPQGYVYPNGYPIPEEELLFVNHPIYAITQGVQGGWYINLQETQVHEDILYSNGNLVGKLSGQIPNGPNFSFQVAAAIGAEETHQFKVGKELLIEATMGYLPDSLNFWEWYYEYSPYIYHSTSDSGGYYVLNFMAQNLGWGYTGIEDENNDQELQVEKPALKVYPNVFKKRVDIVYQIPDDVFKKQAPTLKIFDTAGRKVKDIKLTSTPTNQISKVSWNGTDAIGYRVPDGVYFIQLKAKNFIRTEKVLLLK